MINTDDAEQLFKHLYKNKGRGIGPVYCLSLLYFFIKANWPIYDQYAHIALDAISLNKRPHEFVPYKQINGEPQRAWRDYCEKYVNKLISTFSSKNILREIDRTLWVYGHFFSREIKHLTFKLPTSHNLHF